MNLLFSTFPGGSRGVGLVILRSAVGVAALVHGGIHLLGRVHPEPETSVIGVIAILSGASLVAGFVTALAGGLVAVGATNIAFSSFPLPDANQFEAGLMPVFVAVVAATVILLGPGAFSIDARLFGRREIIIPRSTRSLKS